MARIRWDPASIRALRTDPNVARYVAEVGDDFAREFAALAPKDTGAGAASIQARPARGRSGAVNVGWDAAHFYLQFPEYGTRFQPAQRFARGLLDRYNYL